jgi:hypothetical protein
MAELVITLRTAGAYGFIAGATSTDVRLVGYGGYGGESSGAFGGGGGGGGGFARSTVSTVIGTSYAVVVGDRFGPTTANTSFNTSTVIALSGTIGGNAGLTSGGAKGLGRGGTGDVVIVGSDGVDGSAATGGRGGNAANSGVYPTGGSGGLAQSIGGSPGGGGGGESTAVGVRGLGATGIAVIAYETGAPSISHTPTMGRLLLIYRGVLADVTHVSIFFRLITIRRSFASLTALSSLAPKKVKLPRNSSVLSVSEKTDKRIILLRLAQILHTPAIRKAIRLSAKLAQIANTPIFIRRVTLRRTFSATVTHIQKAFTYLEARLIPSSTGGITIVRKTTILLSDD